MTDTDTQKENTAVRPSKIPWTLTPERAVILDAEGKTIAMLAHPTDERSEDETFANARLLVAAPELRNHAIGLMQVIALIAQASGMELANSFLTAERGEKGKPETRKEVGRRSILDIMNDSAKLIHLIDGTNPEDFAGEEDDDDDDDEPFTPITLNRKLCGFVPGDTVRVHGLTPLREVQSIKGGPAQGWQVGLKVEGGGEPDYWHPEALELVEPAATATEGRAE